LADLRVLLGPLKFLPSIEMDEGTISFLFTLKKDVISSFSISVYFLFLFLSW